MQQNTFDEKLYTSTEVAEILGVSLRSIYRYLDENKIQAEVRTATGRHRFTRQNINDFLHPGKQAPQVSKVVSEDVDDIKDGVKDYMQSEKSEEYVRLSKDSKSDFDKSRSFLTKEGVQPRDVAQDEVEAKSQTKHTESEAEEVKDEPIDWLARFRQAAEKYKTQAPDAVDSNSKEPLKTMSHKSTKLVQEEDSIMEEVASEEPTFNYYRSGVGGLKEIAQSLDKSAKNASLDYAFTMNAGLSLHKPIKPFSLIHAYVRSGDLSYFEKVLQLTACQKDTAQLCLISSNDEDLYNKRRELHGLYVVSDSQIKADLLADGEVELASELE